MAYSSSIPSVHSTSIIIIIIVIFMAFQASVLSHPPRSLASSASLSVSSKSSPGSSSSFVPKTPCDLARVGRSRRQAWPFTFDVLGLARTVVGYAIKFAYEDPRAERWQQEWRNFAHEMRGSTGWMRRSLLSLPALLERMEARGEWLHSRATLRALLSRLRVFHHPLTELRAAGALHPSSAETWAANAVNPTSGIFASLLELDALVTGGGGGETHVLFTVFQGVQVSEARLGDGSCMATCGSSHGPVLPPAQQRARHCGGVLLECQDSWDYVGLGVAPNGDRRRILAMGNIRGPREAAAERWGQKTARLPAWEEVSDGSRGRFAGDYAYTRWFWRCRPCFCICEDPLTNSAEFDLGEVRSDTGRGMVVTGVAMRASTLTDERGIRTRVRLEVRQGRAQPYGLAEPAEPRWRRATGGGGSGSFETGSRSEDASERQARQNATEATPMRTYSVSRERGRATVDLQDVRVDPGCVLTGVAFFERAGHLALKVHQTPIEPDTGRLHAHEGRWKEPPPTTCSFPSVQGLELPPTWLDGRVERGPCAQASVRFAWSSKEQDVAQSTLPAIDTRDVAPDEDAWRYGAGLHLAARQGYAGSVGVSLLDRPDCGSVNVGGSEWTERFLRGGGEERVE